MEQNAISKDNQIFQMFHLEIKRDTHLESLQRKEEKI